MSASLLRWILRGMLGEFQSDQDRQQAPLAANRSGVADFSESMWRQRGQLLRLAQRILRNDDDAEDAVQDAYLKAVLHCSEFAGRSSFLTWLTRIVINQAVGQLRAHRRKPLMEKMSGCGDADGVVCVSQAEDPEQQLLRSERARQLRRALAKIPEKYRIVIELRVEELSLAEAAHRLGTTEGCIKTRLHRANRMLRQRYSGDGADERINLG